MVEKKKILSIHVTIMSGSMLYLGEKQESGKSNYRFVNEAPRNREQKSLVSHVMAHSAGPRRPGGPG